MKGGRGRREGEERERGERRGKERGDREGGKGEHLSKQRVARVSVIVSHLNLQCLQLCIQLHHMLLAGLQE